MDGFSNYSLENSRITAAKTLVKTGFVESSGRSIVDEAAFYDRWIGRLIFLPVGGTHSFHRYWEGKNAAHEPGNKIVQNVYLVRCCSFCFNHFLQVQNMPLGITDFNHFVTQFHNDSGMT